jgi:predicted RecB family endonuclease
MMYSIVPASFILDFGAEDVEEELKKFITFFVECNSKSELNPEKEDLEDMKDSKMSVKKKDTPSTLDSPKKLNVKTAKCSPPTKLSKYRS